MTTASRTIAFTLAAATLAGVSATAQRADNLYFTTLRQEQTNCPRPTSLEQIGSQDVNSVRPAVGPVCAKKFAPKDAYLTLAGDEDNDSSIWEASLGGKVDALTFNPRTQDRTMRDLYVSFAEDLDACVNGNGTPQEWLDGDVGRITAGGQFAWFIREEQIKLAFRMPASEDIDVDAFTVDCSRPMVYLSFEDDHQVFTQNAGLITVGDGAVLAIDIAACGEPCTVPALSGYLVMTEAQVDQLVQNSNVQDRAGNNPMTIEDTDGLHIDAGGFQNQWGNWNNLYFCGETLTGGAVLSTQLNAGGTRGSVAEMNGVPLASTVFPTSGEQVGLRPNAPNAYSLNGLECDPRGCNFVMETPTPTVAPGATLQFDIGGADPGMAIVLLDIKFDAACYAHPTLPFANLCFPEVIAFTLPLGPFPIGPGGHGTGTLNVPAGAPALDLVMQAVTFDGVNFKFSTPISIEVN